MHENDLLLGTFAEKHLETLNEPLLTQYEALLQEIDPDIFGWITGKPCPPQFDNDIMSMIRKHTKDNPLKYMPQ